MKIANLIGSNVLHGSPVYLMKEIVKRVEFQEKGVEIEFESECFTQMTVEEFYDFLRYDEIYYNEMTHGGRSQLCLDN